MSTTFRFTTVVELGEMTPEKEKVLNEFRQHMEDYPAASHFEIDGEPTRKRAHIQCSEDDVGYRFACACEEYLQDVGECAIEGARVEYEDEEGEGAFYIGPSEQAKAQAELEYWADESALELRRCAGAYRSESEAVGSDRPAVLEDLDEVGSAFKGLFAGDEKTLVIGYVPESYSFDYPAKTYVLEGNAGEARNRLHRYMKRLQSGAQAPSPGMPDSETFKAIHFIDKQSVVEFLSMLDPTRREH